MLPTQRSTPAKGSVGGVGGASTTTSRRLATATTSKGRCPGRVKGLSGRQPGFGEVAFEPAAAPLGNLMFGQCCQEASGRPAFLVGLSGKGSPDQFYGGQPQLGEQQLDAGSVAGIGRSSCRTNQLDSAELVIKLQRRHLDGDVGNGGWMWREAPAERVEIGQSSGLEFGVDGPGELGFAGAIMSERQQSDDRAARLLFAVTGQQRFEGAPVGAAREELVTIDQIEQGHWLAAQGMDDVPVIDDVAMLSAGMRPPAAQRRQRRRAEEAFEAVVPRVRLRRPEDRLRAARAAGGRSGATATNRTPS